MIGSIPHQPPTVYPNLLSPIQVGSHRLRNRVIMGSMHTRIEHLDRAVEREVAFYRARAAGEVALVISGGHSPNEAGLMEAGAPVLASRDHLARHRAVTDAVHASGGKMLLQIIHAGRNARHPGAVGASSIPSPIYPYRPRPLTNAEIEATIDDFVHCAELAAESGYDGVEIMGSEGYLINQFTVTRTNDRTDEWGGSVENRNRFPIEIIRRTRARMGSDFLLMFRISAADLVEGGARAEEIDDLARAVEAAGTDILNTGVGWHESPVPTIAYPVPRAAWTFSAARLKAVVSIPVVASNRINTPETAERILSEGEADLVSLARPMLADPDFVKKAREGRRDSINVCIACNQACLDFIFTGRVATCLVNPRAGREIEFADGSSVRSLRVAVVGSGPAGLAAAIEAARRGHEVVLFEAATRIGGQLNIAAGIPGKSEFLELLNYFRRQIEEVGVVLRLGAKATVADLAGFDRVVVASGVLPRMPDIAGIDHPSVVSYLDLLSGRATAGRRVAIIGAGGIAFDAAEMITAEGSETNATAFYHEWGIDPTLSAGGLGPRPPAPPVPEVTIFQRRAGKPGDRLGKTTGWILRNQLKRRGVKTFADCHYLSIDDDGLHVDIAGERRIFAADTIVICAGQERNTELSDLLTAAGIPHDLIGGAEVAAELDARRAIDQGTRLGNAI